MKLRYKKTMLVILLSTMGIGIITLSIVPKHNVKESMNYAEDNNNSGDSMSVSPAEVSPTPQSVSVTPTIAPTPTPLPVYSLEVDAYPDITKLIKSYYKAKLSCNRKGMKKLLSDPSNVATEAQLKEDVQYIEKYDNIQCYVKKGFTQGTYIVFVYNEVKFLNIDTSAPAVYQFYVITDDDGGLKIYSDEFDDVTYEYYQARTEDDDVMKLREETNEKAEQAKEKDEKLKTFWDNLIKAKTAGSDDAQDDSE